MVKYLRFVEFANEGYFSGKTFSNITITGWS